MFKPGEIIVCIETDNYLYPYSEIKLEINKLYTFDKYRKFNNVSILILKEFPGTIFNQNLFVSLQEYRKLKLQKISENR